MPQYAHFLLALKTDLEEVRLFMKINKLVNYLNVGVQGYEIEMCLTKDETILIYIQNQFIIYKLTHKNGFSYRKWTRI